MRSNNVVLQILLTNRV